MYGDAGRRLAVEQGYRPGEAQGLLAADAGLPTSDYTMAPAGLTMPGRITAAVPMGQRERQALISNFGVAQSNQYSYNFTTAWMLGEQRKIAAKSRQPEVRQEFTSKMATQRKLEEALLRTASPCSDATLDRLQENLANLNSNVLSTQVSDRFYDGGVMTSEQCVTESIFFVPRMSEGTLPYNERARHYITGLTQIGEPSINGYAIVASFKGARDLMVMKVPQSVLTDLLLHEAMIAFKALNLLRRGVPNFAYILGVFEASPPLIDDRTREVVAFALRITGKGLVKHVLYENINPSVPARTYVTTCSAEDYLATLMQVVYASMAGRSVNWTHYDLHAGNLMEHEPTGLVMPNQPFLIGYMTERGVYEYLRTRRVATYIDYGFSHVSIRTESGELLSLGGVDYQVAAGVYPDRPFIFHDIYKFFMSSMEAAYYARNEPVLAVGRVIFRYFNTSETLDNVISAAGSGDRYAPANQREIYYALPLSVETAKLSLENFAGYVRTFTDCSFISAVRGSEPLLDCETLCVTPPQVYNDLGVVPQVPVPRNIIEFYDLTTHLSAEGKKDEVARLLADFTAIYPAAMAQHIAQLRGYINVIDSVLQKTVRINLAAMGVPAIYSPESIDATKSFYYGAGKIIDNTMRLHLNYRIGISIAQDYKMAGDVAVLNGLKASFEERMRPAINNFKLQLNANDEYLSRLPPVDKATYPGADWYKTGPAAFNAATRD